MYEASQLSVALGGRPILHTLDVSVPPAQATVVIGPNGAGKSTLLRAMAGEYRRKSGRIRIDGTDLTALRPGELARRRAVLTQSTAMLFPFPVEDVVRLGIPPTVQRVAADRHVAEALAAVKLSGYGDRLITQLSGGEQQRVHMARVFAQLRSHANGGPPGYLLLDEPTAHLDPAHQAQIVALTRSHVGAGGGVLAILHDLNLAAALADNLIVLDKGHIAARGAPGEILTEALLHDVYKVDFSIRDSEGKRRIVQEYA